MSANFAADFAIVIDPENNALRVTMGGFFKQADVDAFLIDLHLKLDQLRAEPNAHLMLCDASRMKIQTQEIVQAFATIVGHPRFRSKRLAFVNGTSLSRLQTRRLTDREGVSFFLSIEAAEAWLFAQPEQQ